MTLPPPPQASASEDIDVSQVIRTNLLRLSRERDLSLDALAKLSGVKLSALADLASGASFPSVGMLWKLAHALDLPCTAFVERPGRAMPLQSAWVPRTPS
jgi:transcriptional regulator with XRE-family HTH domain